MLFCRITLMDSYSTDYYDISYPGLIMKVPSDDVGHVRQYHTLSLQLTYHLMNIPSIACCFAQNHVH